MLLREEGATGGGPITINFNNQNSKTLGPDAASDRRRSSNGELRSRDQSERGSGEYAPSTELDWRDITMAMDGGDTTAKLVVAPDAADLTTAGSIGDKHLSHLLELFNPDLRIRIAQSYAAEAEVYFQGYPLVDTINWHERGQSISCMCLAEGQEILRSSLKAQVLGRRMRWDPLADWNEYRPVDDQTRMITGLLPVFNAGNLPNRSAEAFPFAIGDATHRVHLFVDDGVPGAEHWNLADAMRYLAFFHVLGPALGVSVAEFMADTETLIGMEPAPASEDPFVRRLSARVEDVAVASMSVEEAIHQLTDAAGLHYEIAFGSRVERITTQTELIRGEYSLRVFAALEKPEEADITPQRQSVAPKVFDMPREAPFTDHTGRTERAIALANRAQQANLTVDRRAINAPIILGGYEHYEVTLLLRPGWLPDAEHQLDNLDTPEKRGAALTFWQLELQLENDSAETGEPTSIYHGKSPDHWRVNKVGRYWIFPDDLFWLRSDGGSDYARDGWPAELYGPYDWPDDSKLVLVRSDVGGNIADAQYWVPRRRLFRDLIGRAQEGGSQAPIVRFNFTATDPSTALESPDWVEFKGAEIDTKRAGIRISEPNLWKSFALSTYADAVPDSMNMLEAYINGHFMVSVTCTIRGDRRMVHKPDPTDSSFMRKRYRVIDTGLDSFRYDNRSDQNSHLKTQDPPETDPAFMDRDDTEKFQSYADREAEILVGDTVAGSVDIFWVDPTHRLGDTFTGVDGLGLQFHRYPAIVRKQYIHDQSAGYRTVLVLSDLRESPEVDGE